MNKFNVGDKVIVTNKGGDYTTYAVMAKKMELKNWKRNENVPLNSILEIDVTAKHDDGNNIVYAVSDSDGSQYLVADDYMSLVTIGCNAKQSTAVETLERMGYEWHGGELWKPPLGEPKFKVEYERIEVNSFFDLSEAFSLGEVYFDANGNENTKSKVLTELHLSQLYFHSYHLYRRTEKQVDWRDACRKYLTETESLSTVDGLEECLSISWLGNEFLELCRTALRARGEL